MNGWGNKNAAEEKGYRLVNIADYSYALPKEAEI
jgi:hypothetical protein